VGLGEKGLELFQSAIHGVNGVIIADVIAIIFERRWVERQQPNRRDAQGFQIIEFLCQPTKIADAIGVLLSKKARTCTS